MPMHCLVTGANRGLGLEFARQLLARGDHVVATCRHPGRATALNRLSGEYPGRIHVLPLDVADPNAHVELARELPLVLNGQRLELLINNAGVLHSGERFGALTPAQIEDAFRVNAAAPLLITQAIADVLDDRAKVANISSQLGSIANTSRFGTPSYAISKAAQNMATVQLAGALRDRGITVLALHPGWVQTDMGGTQASIAPPQAVAGLLRVIDAATMERSGGFFDWQGERLPW